MKKILIIILMMIAVECSAQWWTDAGTNPPAWPSWQYPRAGKTQDAQTYSGLVERADGVSRAGTTITPTPPRWFRFQRTNLKNAKGTIIELMSRYADYTQADTNGIFVPLSTNNIFAMRFNPSNMAFVAKIPTNYFAYTPFRCLNGLGPFTNDQAAVGHAHGWTNKYTANGGTNFPPGRDTWYTTDYTRDQITNILSHLKWTLHTSRTAGATVYSNYYWGYSSNGTNDLYRGNAQFATNSYTPLKAAAEADWKLNVFGELGDGPLMWSFLRQFIGNPFGAGLVSRKVAAVAINISTNYEHEVDFYVWATPPIGFDPEWDNNSQGVVSNQAVWFFTDSPSFDSIVTSSDFGSINKPVWRIGLPTNDGLFYRGFRGILKDDSNIGWYEAAVIKWTETPLGFKYK